MSERRRGRRAAGQRSWWERFLFSFMGPPQLGDLRAPPARPRDPQADLCHTCGLPWDAHERVHASNMTYTRCPPAHR